LDKIEDYEAPNKEAQAWLVQCGLNKQSDFDEVNSAYEAGDIVGLKRALKKLDKRFSVGAE
jgi:hypothetical protein